ncbi:MAG: hypothetical protein D6682_07145 [Zetaproteobacteria bacterium]|nr:MAG: hypothetical protein D6682_07145 [Zetaproteobacteria bacterium]
MTLFSYEAIDAAGKRRRGEVDADSERAARKVLRARGLVPRLITPAAPSRSRERRVGGRSAVLDGDELTAFLQQLATLSEAGMPLAEALGSIAEGMERRMARRTVAAIRQHVVEGGSLAEAMAAQQMDDIVCNMVAAGEETGQLEAVASRLAELLERRQQMRQELLSATLYPAIILGFGLVVMLFLLAVVVPQIVAVFARTGAHLPLITRMMIAASSFLRDHGLLLLAIAAGLPLLYHWSMRHPALRRRRDRLLLRLPGVRALIGKIETARYCRTLGMLLAGGVPALAAMQIATESVTLLPLRRVTESAREALREGSSLADALADGGYVPHLALRMIAVGEQSGRLDAMLIKVADTFERESSRVIKRLITVLEPALVLLMAVGVGSLAMAILLPIVEMNQLVR